MEINLKEFLATCTQHNSDGTLEIDTENFKLKFTITQANFDSVRGRVAGNSNSNVYISDNGEDGIFLAMNAQLASSATLHIQSQNTDEEQENQDD